MIFDPIERKDKQNRTIVLRSAEASDAEALLRFLKVTAEETPFLVREPSEIRLTLEEEEAFIRAKKEDGGELLLVATLDGEHIGNCSLMKIAPWQRYAHRCGIAIALYQEYCGAGIGTLMLETLLLAARKTGYEQAELEVVSSNAAAIALYEKLGFRKYGSFPCNMKYEDGTYASADWMMKKLEEEQGK